MSTPGLLEDLSDRVAKDDKIKQDDISPFFREFSQKFNGKTYMLTLDGDFHMAYFRTDVAKEIGMEAPKTWDEYLAFAAAAHGKDMNGDGKARFRLLHLQKAQRPGLLVHL